MVRDLGVGRVVGVGAVVRDFAGGGCVGAVGLRLVRWLGCGGLAGCAEVAGLSRPDVFLKLGQPAQLSQLLVATAPCGVGHAHEVWCARDDRLHTASRATKLLRLLRLDLGRHGYEVVLSGAEVLAATHAS